MSRCRIVVITLALVMIVPGLAHSHVNVANDVRVGRANIRDLEIESDPSDSQECSSLGELDIAFQTDSDGPPKVGMVVSDPRGRRIGFDPLTKKA